MQRKVPIKVNILHVVIVGLLAMSLFSAAAGAETKDPDAVMVVTASRIPQEILEAPVSVTVITQDDIQRAGASTVAEVLRHVEGIAIRQQAGWGSLSTISIRGSESNQVLVLRNGRRLNSPRDGQVDLGRISLAGVERIEVLKGPASALYGADALGGVVNIITKTGAADRAGEVAVSFGEYGTQVAQVRAEGALSMGSWTLSAEKIRSAGFRTNSDYDGFLFDGSIALQLSPRDAVTVGLSHHQGEVGVPGHIDWSSLYSEARQEDQQTHLDLAYERILSMEEDLAVRLYSDSSRLGYENPAMFEDSLHRAHTTGLDVQFNQDIAGGRHRLSLGGSGLQEEVKSTDYDKIQERHSWAIFAQDVYNLSPVFNVTVGGRYDDYSTHGGSATYRLGAAYNPRPGTRIYGSVGTAFRAPTFNDLYWGTTPWSAGNPDLKPETASAYELGIDQEIGTDLTVSASVYQRKVDQLIDWTETSPGFWQPVNRDKAAFRGWEARAVKQFGAQLTVSLGYEYLDARDESTGDRLPYRAKHKGSLQADFQAPQGLQVSTQLLVVSERPTGGEPLPGYSVLDLSIKQPIRPDLTVQMSIKNLLDEKYEQIAGYPAPPRQLLLGVSYSF